MLVRFFSSLVLRYPAPPAGEMAWQAAAHGASRYIPVTRYDPKRNPSSDLAKALAEAKRTGRNVLLVVGGDWCDWCHLIVKFFDYPADVWALRERNSVTLNTHK